MEVTIIKRIWNNLKFRYEVYKSSPFYIKEKFKFGLYKSLKPYINLRISVKLNNNAKIYLGYDPVDDYILDHLMGNDFKRYFPDNLILNQKELVLDVGSHNGIYSTILSKYFIGVKIICVEPNPISLEYLKRHSIKNHLNIKIVPYAIGSSSESRFLVDNNDGSWGKTVEDAPSKKSIVIQTITLAEILKNVDVNNLQLIKSNCEGGEFTLVDQLIELNIKPRFLILMIHPEKGYLKELVDKLTAYGYRYSIAWKSDINPCYHFFI